LQKAACNPTYGVPDILNEAQILYLRNSPGDVSECYPETLRPLDGPIGASIIHNGCFMVDKGGSKLDVLSQVSVNRCNLNRYLHKNVMSGSSEVGHEISI
jgi:hypothetical protein